MLNLNLPKKVGLMPAGILAVAIPVILGVTNAAELRAQAKSVPKEDLTGAIPYTSTLAGNLRQPEAIHSGRIAACRACAQTSFSLRTPLVNDKGRYRQSEQAKLSAHSSVSGCGRVCS